MKTFILLSLIMWSSLAAHAQFSVSEVAGSYERTLLNNNDHSIIYKLNLNLDGTFDFHSFYKKQSGFSENRRIEETNQYAKGTWTLDKKVISFFSASADFDEKYTLNLDTSKARFIKKHPRDKSDKFVKTSLQFYQAPMDWIQSLSLFKRD